MNRHTGSFLIGYVLYSSIPWSTELMVNMCVGVAELNNRDIASHFIPCQLQKPQVAIGDGLTGIFTEGA